MKGLELEGGLAIGQHLKPKTELLRSKSYQNRQLVFFHEFLDSSQIHRPAQGKHTVIVVVQEAPGFPSISTGSHLKDITSISTTSMTTIPQEKGSVVVFKAGIACQYPAVDDVGGYSYCYVKYRLLGLFGLQVMASQQDTM